MHTCSWLSRVVCLISSFYHFIHRSLYSLPLLVANIEDKNLNKTKHTKNAPMLTILSDSVSLLSFTDTPKRYDILSEMTPGDFLCALEYCISRRTVILCMSKEKTEQLLLTPLQTPVKPIKCLRDFCCCCWDFLGGFLLGGWLVGWFLGVFLLVFWGFFVEVFFCCCCYGSVYPLNGLFQCLLSNFNHGKQLPSFGIPKGKMDSDEIHKTVVCVVPWTPICLKSFSALPPNSAFLMYIKFPLTLMGKSVTPSGAHSQ